MVKIKDFIIGSKKLGGGARAPMPYTTSAHEYVLIIFMASNAIFINK